jgi:hypothetical protein
MQCLLTRGHVPIFGFRRAASAVVAVATVVLLAVLATNFRQYVHMGTQNWVERAQLFQEETRADRVEGAWLSLRHGVFGHIYAFSYWFDRAYDAPPKPLWGVHFFAGPLSLLGLKEREPSENFFIEPGVESNVYTLFRIVIEDWGFAGSLVVFFLVGLLVGVAYDRVAHGRLIPQVILCIYYTYVISIGGHVLVYNSLILTFTLCAAYLIWLNRRLQSIALTPRPQLG